MAPLFMSTLGKDRNDWGKRWTDIHKTDLAIWLAFICDTNIIFCTLSKRSILILLQNLLPPVLQSSSFQAKLLGICSWVNVEKYLCSSLLSGKLSNQVYCLEFCPLGRFLNTVLIATPEWSQSAAGIPFQLLPVLWGDDLEWEAEEVCELRDYPWREGGNFWREKNTSVHNGTLGKEQRYLTDFIKV